MIIDLRTSPTQCCHITLGRQVDCNQSSNQSNQKVVYFVLQHECWIIIIIIIIIINENDQGGIKSKDFNDT